MTATAAGPKPLTLATVRADRLYRTADVAAVFAVCPKTVRRWADAGRIEAHPTPTGKRRFFGAEILRAWGAKVVAEAVPALTTERERDERLRAAADRLYRRRATK